jgi:hypothetical protein
MGRKYPRQTSGGRGGDHEERGVPVADIPRHVTLARGVFQQDQIPGTEPPGCPARRLHLHLARQEDEELPGRGRVQFTYPAGLECVKAIFRRGPILGDVERGSGRRCTHEDLFDRHDIKVRVTLRVRIDSVIRHPGEIWGGCLRHDFPRCDLRAGPAFPAGPQDWLGKNKCYGGSLVSGYWSLRSDRGPWAIRMRAKLSVSSSECLF